MHFHFYFTMLICVMYSKKFLEENTAMRVCYDDDGVDDENDDDDVKTLGHFCSLCISFLLLDSTTVWARYPQMLKPNEDLF